MTKLFFHKLKHTPTRTPIHIYTDGSIQTIHVPLWPHVNLYFSAYLPT